MTRRRLQEMAAWMLVTAATATHAATPSTGELSNSPGVSRLKAPSAWQMGATGQRVVIAVIDTGVNAAHIDLAGRVLTGYNALNGSTYTADGNGHGTHIAGILAGAANGRGIVGIPAPFSIPASISSDSSGSPNSAKRCESAPMLM